jgi:serine/threonine-protein kinase
VTDDTGSLTGSGGLPVDQARQVEEVCDAFEAGWRTGDRPDIASAVADLPEPVRSAVLRELVELDVYYRRRTGEAPAAADYSGRFPDLDPDWLATAVAEPARTLPPLGAGTVFGDYELIEGVGRGGMGVVFKARQVSLNRTVAVKVLHGGGDRGRCLAEARAMARLHHPNIARVLEVARGDGPVFFSMEWYPGGTLAGRADEFAGRPHRAALVVERVARAVHHAHQRGILHRDLKPTNVLLDADGEPRVADFGLAVLLWEPDSAGAAGTPAFMAPEQLTGDVTVATDVHGLGAILYALLTGRAPFAADGGLEMLERVRASDPVPPSRLNPRVDADLDAVCRKCLAKDPADRYRSAADVADDLERYRLGLPTLALPLGPLARVARAVRQARAAADFRTLGPGLIGMAAFVLASNAAVFGLLRAAAAEAWVWAAVFASYVPLFALLARDRWADRGRHNPGRLHLWAIWAGHAAACAAVFVAHRIAAGPDFARGIETGYIGCAGMNALAFVMMGSLFAGRQYILGVTWAVGAVGMALALPWAPLIYAGLMAACSLTTALQLKSLGPDDDATADPGSSRSLSLAQETQ